MISPSTPHEDAQAAAALRHVRDVVRRSGTSFWWAMCVLPRERRQAMYAIYAFCREVDDVVDQPGDARDKRRQLDAWRQEIDALYCGVPSRPTTRALRRPVSRFALPKQEFMTIIDGMAADAVDELRIPNMDGLLSYCRKVAGAVGMLAIQVFGVNDESARKVPVALGNALQLTNILRDIGEDAARNRLYLPEDLLARHGVPKVGLDDILGNPGFSAACQELATHARGWFAETDRLLAIVGRRRMRPAVMMMEVYRNTLDRLERDAWHTGTPVVLPRALKLWLAFRHGLW